MCSCGGGGGSAQALMVATAKNGATLQSTDRVVLETFLAANGGGSIVSK